MNDFIPFYKKDISILKDIDWLKSLEDGEYIFKNGKLCISSEDEIRNFEFVKKCDFGEGFEIASIKNGVN